MENSIWVLGWNKSQIFQDEIANATELELDETKDSVSLKSTNNEHQQFLHSTVQSQ